MDTSPLGGLRAPLPVSDFGEDGTFRGTGDGGTFSLPLDSTSDPIALPGAFNQTAPHPDPASDGPGHISDVAYGIASHPIDLVPSHPIPPLGATLAGTAPQAVDRELADISAAVYDPTKTSAAGWDRLDDSELLANGIDPATLVDDSTSFKAGIYEKDGNYVLAFAGTEGAFAGKDWWTNLKQGTGFDAAQYRSAEVLAVKAKEAFGKNLALTGHSLGGGLASAASAASGGTPAVTFNPAGVNDNTYTRLGLDPATERAKADAGSIRRYVVGGEVLDYLQEKNHLLTVGAEFGPIALGASFAMPKGVGHRIELADPDPQPWYKNVIAPLAANHSVGLHFMPSVTAAMDKSGLFAGADVDIQPTLQAIEFAPAVDGRFPFGTDVVNPDASATW